MSEKMKSMVVMWLRERAAQCDKLGFGNDAALFKRASGDLAKADAKFFVVDPRIPAAMAIADPVAADVAAAIVVDEKAVIAEEHAANVVEGEKLVVSGPPSTAPAAPAPDSPAVQPPAEVVDAAKAAETPTVEEMAAKFAASAPDAKP